MPLALTGATAYSPSSPGFDKALGTVNFEMAVMRAGTVPMRGNEEFLMMRGLGWNSNSER